MGCPSSSISRNMPSGWPPSSGRPLVAPTRRTPGQALELRRSGRRRSAPAPPFAPGSSSQGSATSIARIPSTRNPGFTSSTVIRLRPSSPAPTTRTSVTATCAATIARPARWPPSEPACPRPPSRAARRLPEVAWAAVTAPRPAATAVERSRANSSTGRLIETLSSRGRFAGAARRGPPRPRTAASTPTPPPRSESSSASVRSWRTSRPRGAPARREWPARAASPWPAPAAGWPRSRTATSSRKPTAPQQHQQRQAGPARDRVGAAGPRSRLRAGSRPARSLPRHGCAGRWRSLSCRACSTLTPCAQSPDRLEIVRSPARVLALEPGRQPQVDARREAKAGRQHTDHRERTVDLELRPGEVRGDPRLSFQ